MKAHSWKVMAFRVVVGLLPIVAAWLILGYNTEKIVTYGYWVLAGMLSMALAEWSKIGEGLEAKEPIETVREELEAR